MANIDINQVQKNIEELQDQNAIDFQQWKRLGQEIEELTANIKTNDNRLRLLMEKIKSDYENLKKEIIDENAYLQLSNKIEENKNQIEENKKEISKKVSNETFNNTIDSFNGELNTKAQKYKSEIVGIKGWRQPNQNKKIVFVGDSTTDVASSIYSEIKKYYLGSGDKLSGVTEDNLINMGSNGNTLANFINNIPSGKGIDDVIALKPDLIIFCYGINDVRLGNTTLERLIELHDNAITRLLEETNAYILLRTPHTLCSDSPNGYISPSNSGQAYSDILWNCYESFRGKYPKTDVLDLQTIIFGRTSRTVAENSLMADELHANNNGQAYEGTVIAEFIGEKPSKDMYKDRRTTSYLDYPKKLENNPLYEKICEGYFLNMGTNYLDFALDKSHMNKIQKGDIVKIGDELAYDFTGNVYANGNNIRLSQTFNNYENNKKGLVEIYRAKINRENIGFYSASIKTGEDFSQSYCFSKNIVATNFKCKSNFPISNGATFTLCATHNGTKSEICEIVFTNNNMTGTFSWVGGITSKLIENYDFVTLTCKSITYDGEVRISIIIE